MQAQAGAAAQPDEDPELPTEKDVSVAYCSIAEIYLTDLWYQSAQSYTLDTDKPVSWRCCENFFSLCACSMEEGAADKCREFIEKALQYHHDNPEALQLMASYLFSTERNQVSPRFLSHMCTHTHLRWVIITLKQESAELIILSKLNCMPLISRWTGHADRNVNYWADH